MAADTGLVVNALCSMSVQPGPRATPKLSEPEFSEFMNWQNSNNSLIQIIRVQILISAPPTHPDYATLVAPLFAARKEGTNCTNERMNQ